MRKNQALCEIVSKQGVHIRSKAGFPVPFNSLIEVITHVGVKLSPWCFGIEKRQSLLDAVRSIANVSVIVVPLTSSEKQEFTWNCNPIETELCLIAEKGNQFGGIIRVRVFEKQANISLLAARSHFKNITLNGRGGGYEERVHFSQALVLKFVVDHDVTVCLRIVQE